MTLDIDCALDAADFSDDAAAERSAREIVADLARLGFNRIDDRASRKARFSYSHSTAKVDVELLCGNVPVGRSSRRAPAWKIAATAGEPPGFYAAKVPWLDFVEDWVSVRATCGAEVFTPQVPDLSGLTLLKVCAVVDKIRRVDQESRVESVEHEMLRLRRHGRDCLLLFEWIDERGEFDRLNQLASKHQEVRSVASEGARWALNNDALVSDLGLSGLDRSLERLA